MKTLDGDFDAWFDEVRLEPVANHPARRSSLEGPPFHFAAWVLHVEKEPRVRILETDLHDRALDRDGLVHVERRGKRVVRRCSGHRAERNETPHQNSADGSLHTRPPSGTESPCIVPRGLASQAEARQLMKTSLESRR